MGRWRRVPLAWRRAIVAILVLRLVTMVAAFAFGGLLPSRPPQGRMPVDVEPLFQVGWQGWEAQSAQEQGIGLIGAGLERFDALWYLAIARDGYPERFMVRGSPSGSVPGAAAFFPGLPLVLAVSGRLLFGHYLLAANLVALAAGAAALAGVHRLVEEETGDQELARRAVITLAVFPSAFFLVAPYTEPLFLATTAWTLVWARRGRWAPAAALAFAATLTRHVGVLLVLPLLYELWRQRRREGRPVGVGAFAAAFAAAPAGLAAYGLFSWWRWGTPLAPLRAQSVWEREWMLPTESLGNAWRFATETPGLYPSGYHSTDLIIFTPVAAAVVWLLMRAPAGYGLYAGAHVLVWLTYPFPGRPLMSAYRFAIAVVPLSWAFAAWTRRRGVSTVWDASSAALAGVMLLLFVAWYFVF